MMMMQQMSQMQPMKGGVDSKKVEAIVEKMLGKFEKDKMKIAFDSVNRLVSLLSRDSLTIKNQVTKIDERLTALEERTAEDQKNNEIAQDDLAADLQKERDEIFLLDRKLNYSRRLFARERSDLMNKFEEVQ